MEDMNMSNIKGKPNPYDPQYKSVGDNEQSAGYSNNNKSPVDSEFLNRYNPYLNNNAATFSRQHYDGNNASSPPPPPAPAMGKKVKRTRSVVGIVVASVLAVGLAGVLSVQFFTAVSAPGRRDDSSYADSSSITGSDNENKPPKAATNSGVEVVLPVAPLPEVEPQYRDSSGLYTTQGLVKATKDGMVKLGIYLGSQTIAPNVQGSGVIISTDGYVVTNAHVVTDDVNNQKVRVKIILSNGEEYEADIVGTDTKTDLAILKFEPKDVNSITSIPIGSSDLLELGEQVVAIGNSYGQQNTVTVGHISALDVEYAVTNPNAAKLTYIQFDAAINPGSSGGALLNMHGHLVGITSWKKYYSEALDPENAYPLDDLFFAIPIDRARPVMEELISKGYVSGRPWIGLSFVGVDVGQASPVGLEAGLLVADVIAGSPAEGAGFMENDIVTHFNGTRIYNVSEIFDLLEGLSPGDLVSIGVLRKDILGPVQSLEFNFTLGEVTSGNN